MPRGWKIGDGYIEVHLVGPDKKQIEDLKRQAKEWGKVKVQVDIDKDKFDKGADEVERKTKKIGATHAKPKISADDKEAQARLKRLREHLEFISKKVATAKLDVRDQRSRSQIRQMELALERLDHKVSSPKIDIDGMIGAESKLIAINRQLDKFDGFDYAKNSAGFGRVSAALRAMGEYTPLVVAGLLNIFGPALLASMKVFAIGLLGITGSLVAATAAAGVFGAVAFNAFTKIKKEAKDVEAWHKKVKTATNEVQIAEMHLAQADSSKERAAAKKELAKAQQKVSDATNMEKAALGQLKGPLGAATLAYIGLKDAWNKFLERNAPQTYGVITGFFTTLSSVIPSLQPLFNVAYTVIDKFMKRVEGFAKSKAFDTLVSQLASIGGPALESILNSAANFIAGFMNAIMAFAPAGNNFFDWLEKVSLRFKNWTKSDAFKQWVSDLVQWARENGPKVVDFLKAFWDILVKLASWLESGGSEDLDRLAGALRKIGDALEWIDQHRDTIQMLWSAITFITPTWRKLADGIDAFGRAWDKVKGFFGKNHKATFSADGGQANTTLTGLLARVGKWAGKKFVGFITGNNSNALSAIGDTLRRVGSWIGKKFQGVLTGNGSHANNTIGGVLVKVAKWAGKNFLGRLTGNNSHANSVIAETLRRVGGWFGKRFLGHLTGNNSNALSSINATLRRVTGWFGKRFLGHLTGNNSNALSSIGTSVARAVAFARGRYLARLSADFGGVISSVENALSAARRWAGKVFTATLNVRKIIPGLATGGYTGDFSTSSRYRGGMPNGGLVTGPGGSTDDTAGVISVSHKEFVVNGQETRNWLGLLRLINSGALTSVASRGRTTSADGGGSTFTGDIYVTIPAKDIMEMRNIIDFLRRIEIATRQGAHTSRLSRVRV